MPLYEYKCTKCGHRFEKIQKFSDRKIKKCPECGGPVEQTVTAAAVQFKGSGWYVTDYAKKSTTPSNSDGSYAKDASKDGAAKTERSRKEGSSKESTSKETSGKESSTKESPAKESSSKESSTKKAGKQK